MSTGLYMNICRPRLGSLTVSSPHFFFSFLFLFTLYTDMFAPAFLSNRSLFFIFLFSPSRSFFLFIFLHFFFGLITTTNECVYPFTKTKKNHLTVTHIASCVCCFLLQLYVYYIIYTVLFYIYVQVFVLIVQL